MGLSQSDPQCVGPTTPVHPTSKVSTSSDALAARRLGLSVLHAACCRRTCRCFRATSRKPTGDTEAALELLGELGGSHIRFLFAHNCTLADSGRGCNRIAKLLKKLVVIRRIVYQASILA
jgi:hypothetical protein